MRFNSMIPDRNIDRSRAGLYAMAFIMALVFAIVLGVLFDVVKALGLALIKFVKTYWWGAIIGVLVLLFIFRKFHGRKKSHDQNIN